MGFVSLDLKQRTKMNAKTQKENEMTPERRSMYLRRPRVISDSKFSLIANLNAEECPTTRYIT